MQLLKFFVNKLILFIPQKLLPSIETNVIFRYISVKYEAILLLLLSGMSYTFILVETFPRICLLYCHLTLLS